MAKTHSWRNGPVDSEYDEKNNVHYAIKKDQCRHCKMYRVFTGQGSHEPMKLHPIPHYTYANGHAPGSSSSGGSVPACITEKDLSSID